MRALALSQPSETSSWRRPELRDRGVVLPGPRTVNPWPRPSTQSNWADQHRHRLEVVLSAPDLLTALTQTLVLNTSRRAPNHSQPSCLLSCPGLPVTHCPLPCTCLLHQPLPLGSAATQAPGRATSLQSPPLPRAAVLVSVGSTDWKTGRER